MVRSQTLSQSNPEKESVMVRGVSQKASQIMAISDVERVALRSTLVCSWIGTLYKSTSKT